MKIDRRKIILSTFILLLLGAKAWTQQGSKTIDINYTVGIPTGNLKDLTNKTSFRGFEAAVLYDVSDRLALGVQAGFQDFYQKYPRQTYSEAGYDLSAVITNSVQTIPIMLKAKYRLSTKNSLYPYVSLAAGGNLIRYEKYYGEFADGKDAFGFAAQPELGLHIPLGNRQRAGFHLAAGYNYMPFKYNDANGLSHAVLKAGFSFAVNE